MKKLTPNYDEGMWKGAPASSFAKAQTLRKNETETEKLLWNKLKNNQLQGYKFRRQHPINLYIADFYCHKLKLIIEIDGDYHNTNEQKEKDIERTQILNCNDIRVIRFTNEDIINNIENVLLEISKYIPTKEN